MPDSIDALAQPGQPRTRQRAWDAFSFVGKATSGNMVSMGESRRDLKSVLARGLSGLLCLALWATANAAVAHHAQAGRATTETGTGAHAYANRLVDSNNPYLLLHAHNPVDWYPWGPEAIAKARAEHKPIFLSVGYSTCYWCHVAERTLYSKPEIAKLMNQWFVNVKVDREERPDVDRIYMLARQILTGPGGWPNNVFLTPDLKPFFAGSYFPPDDDGSGRPSFPSVLERIHRAWTTEREEVYRQAERVYKDMRRVQEPSAGSDEAPVTPARWLARARDRLLSRFDLKYGGQLSSGRSAKFPRSPTLDLLLIDFRINRTRESLDRLMETLHAMAFGGIYDHLGGGFHRYSTDRRWWVPHFEKMLYDNAQLLRIYAQAYEVSSNPLYRQVAVDVARYLSGRLMSPQGGFYTAEDAAVNGEEGASYLWNGREILTVLGTEAASRFFGVYFLTPMSPRRGSAGKGANNGVLRVRIAMTGARLVNSSGQWVNGLAALEAERRKLLAVRNARPQPARDDKIMVDFNGLAIQAFATSGKILRDARYVALARKAAERIWNLAYNPKTGELKHQIFRGHVQTEGYLADYALLGQGFMALYEATKEDIWRKRAESLADALLQRFAREDGGLSTTVHEKDLLIAPRDTGDGAYPSGTSATIDLLLHLNAVTGNARYSREASRVLRNLSGRIERRPENFATAVVAVNRPEYGTQSRPVSIARRTAVRPEDQAKAGGFHMPDTADHVRATAAARHNPERDEIVVTVQVDNGYHINANPASLDYLVPTSIAFETLIPSRITYPRSIRFNPAFSPVGLDVYEGSVELVAIFPKGTLADDQTIRASVTAQACNDETCLPPAQLPVSVRVQ